MRRSAFRHHALCAIAFASVQLPACTDAVPADDVARTVAFAADAKRLEQPESTTALVETLGCGACHVGLPSPRSGATPLAAGAGPRDPASMFTYLNDSLPARTTAGARMPDFHLDEREALALALHLGRGDARGPARRAFEQARRRHRDVDAEDGAGLYDAFACAACHGRLDRTVDAPPLALEGARVRPEWLRAFLRAPHPIRPFGRTPGSGTRMPDFGLSDVEVDAIASLLLENTVALPAYEPQALTPFAMVKTQTLLETRFDCLGCHALDGRGGRIAPDLAHASTRLTQPYLRAMLDDPARHAPGTIMPRPRLTPAQRDVIAAFLSSRAMNAAQTTSYLSPLDHATNASDEAAGGERLYLRSCAVCHGASGEGNGFNARYLDVTPAAHADSAAMARRPDDTLYDGIASGGRILGRSARMPAFGASFDDQEIRALIAHIRTLCDCAPPAWSTDGAR